MGNASLQLTTRMHQLSRKHDPDGRRQSSRQDHSRDDRSSVDVIVQAQRMRDGSRKITHVTEVIGLEGRSRHLAGPVYLRGVRRGPERTHFRAASHDRHRPATILGEGALFRRGDAPDRDLSGERQRHQDHRQARSVQDARGGRARTRAGRRAQRGVRQRPALERRSLIAHLTKLCMVFLRSAWVATCAEPTGT